MLPDKNHHQNLYLYFRYDVLTKSGGVVLDGTHLDEAVQNLISVEEESVSVEDLQ